MRSALLAAVFALGCGSPAQKQAGESCVASSECAPGLLCDLGQTPHVCAGNGTPRPDAGPPAPDANPNAPDANPTVPDATPAPDATPIDATPIDATPIDAAPVG